MNRKEFIKTVEVLLRAVKDNFLSSEDFMERLNSAYENFGEVTFENLKGK